MTVNVVKATDKPRRSVSLFLAGAIDNGQAVDWQADLEKHLEEQLGSHPRIDVTIYNPRRDDWNPNADTVELTEQINWELDRLDEVDIVVFVFPEDSKAPITFLELGMQLERRHSRNVIVHCPYKFYRYQNIATTCARYGVYVHSDIHSFYENIVSEIIVLDDLA